MARYRPVEPRVSFPDLERRVLERWREGRVFERSLKLREGSPEWVFYDGPPTANGRPHIGHVEARTFKDVYPRYKTMTGYYVHRKAGWDCHGLPVELEVEKEIGTRTKRDIEAFGIAEFNRRCRESVLRYVDDWSRLTERIGFWIDMENPYRTMDTEYVESVWWSLKTLFERGLLFQADRVTAYCPRCGTALSDHEVSQGYTQVTDPSAYVKFPITEPSMPGLEGSSLVGWTTTPWTLISNVGLAVDPDATYARVRIGSGGDLVVAEAVVDVLEEGAHVVATFTGAEIVGSRYAPPFENVDGDTHRVVAADFVMLDEGTGIVHMAPAFGPEDLEIGRREGWPVFKPVDDAGRFTDEAPEFVRGRFVKEADPDIIEDMRARGVLVRAESYEHTYPLCWRCNTPLLYYARTSWYLRTTERKQRMLEVNEGVGWYPDHIKHGRYGDWLSNNVDWALSRERYWGTPLPIWRCAAGHTRAVGSLQELSSLAGRDVSEVDPHRPAIDEVAFACTECGGESRRAPEVIDAWYDSGAMPFAQWGYHPDLGRGLEELSRRFPADFIAEGLDQTRGWFYSLMAEGVLLFDETAYRNVICHGLVVDREGRKMSKSIGNVIDPFEMIDRHGADAVRWSLIVGGSPWEPRRLSFEAVEEVVRQFLLTLWNVYSFYVTYAIADGFDPGLHDIPAADRPVLDRWILSRLARTVGEARERLEAFDATGAGRRMAALVEDLSNWYVRRARRRFWDPGRGDAGAEKWAAYLTLEECLVTLAQLLAPLTPFLSEELWSNLAAGREGLADSVHLTDYPEPDAGRLDDPLEEAMRIAREVARLGRLVRNEARVKVRQPLRTAIVHVPGGRDLSKVIGIVADELNVREVELSESAQELGRWRAKPNFKVLGPRLGARVKDAARALAEDDGTLAAALAGGEAVQVAGVSLDPADVELVQETREGFGVASDGGVTVALDLAVDEELRLEGLARDLVRVVQDARKAAGLDVSDGIELGIEATGELAAALEAHGAYVAGETLARSVATGPISGAEGDPDLHEMDTSVDGIAVRISLARTRG